MFSKIQLFTLAFLLCLSSIAQRRNVDSLLKLLEQPKYQYNDTVTVNTTIELSYRYYQINPDSTLFYAEKALALSQNINYKMGKGMSYNRMAVAYAAKGNLEKAVELYYLALNIAEQENNERWISSALNNIGYVFRQLNDYDKAMQLTIRSYELSKKIKNVQAAAINLTNIAWLNLSKGNTAEALANSYESMKLAAQVNDDYHVAISYHLAGKVFLQINNIDSANFCFNQGLKFAKKAQIKSQIAYNTLGLGDVNLAVKNYTAAVGLLQEALTMAKEAQVLEIQEQAVKGLVTAYKATNNIYLHNDFLQQHLQLKDSIYNVDKQKIITRTQIAYEVEKKQQKLQQQQTELKLQRIILYLLLGVAMVLIGLIYLLAQKQKALKHNNELLHHANEELTIQRVELVKQSEELKLNNQHRAKLFSIIAHDLRSPMANLGGIIEHIDILTKEDIAQLKQMITPTFKTIDGVLNNLLQWSSQQLSGAHTQTTQVNLNKLVDTNIKLLSLNAKAKNIEIEQQIDDDVLLLADEQQLGIVVRNLLSNAIKFTNDNGKIAISAKKDNQQVAIQIADNGVGMSKQQLDALFNPATHFSRYGTKQEKGVGLGLILTKEFVEKNKGTITASSIEGKGTIFELIFPVLAENT